MLVLNEEERMLADSAKEFLQGVSPIAAQRKIRDEKLENGFEQDVWQQVIEMGWSALAFDEQYDGLGFSYKGLSAVFESIGNNLSATPLLSSVVLCGELLARFGSEAARTELLGSIITGEQRFALALDEGMHHAPDAIDTSATASENGYTLNGSKALVIDGIGADGYLLIAAEAQGLSAFLIPAETSGLSVTPCQLIDSRNYCQLASDDVKVPASAKITGDDFDQEGLQQVLDIARVCIAAEILGASQQLFDMTVDYLKTRVQFSVPIGSFQALQHRAAWLFTELELARSCVLNAALTIDEAKSDENAKAKLAQAVSLAMYKVSVMADKVTSEAVQLHGGIGVTDELDIGLLLKRVRVAQSVLGDRNYHQLRYSQTLVS